MRFLHAALLLAAHFATVLCAERSCSSDICLNGGTCKIDDEKKSFQCYCLPGFTGTICQDECLMECGKGQCKSGDGGEYCDCPKGWAGRNCELSTSGSIAGCTSDTDCKNGKKCLVDSRGRNVCAMDSCDPNPCKNDAKCSNDGDSFVCQCPTGFSGKLCDQATQSSNQCDSSPCANGGTCVDVKGGYKCVCNGRFRGPQCEQTACSPSPCQNNGTCLEMMTGYQCACLQGYMGKNCETEAPVCKCPHPSMDCRLVNGQSMCTCPAGTMEPDCVPITTPVSITIPENPCLPNPCKNQGSCYREGEAAKCTCLPDFEGDQCDRRVDCRVQGITCKNDGVCIRGLATTHCECRAGFTGFWCESREPYSSHFSTATIPMTTSHPNDVTEWANQSSHGEQGFDPRACAVNRCQNGGRCVQVGDPLEDGFSCECPAGFEGNFCESVEMTTVKTTTVPTTSWSREEEDEEWGELPSHCSECDHSKRCVSTTKGAVCVCEEGWHGPRCERRGALCASRRCPGNQQCQVEITATKAKTKCACPVSFSGADCLADTSLSFDEQSLFVHQSDGVMIGSSSGPLPFSLSFSLRTTVPDVHIATGENIFGQRHFRLYLEKGRLVANISGRVHSDLLSVGVNDGVWKRVEMRKGDTTVHLSLTDEDGHRLIDREMERAADWDVFSTRIGRVGDKSFIGCLADISIDDTPVNVAASPRAVKVNKGCRRTAQCSATSCQNGGVCVDMWTRFECACQPPHLPPYCIHAVQASTFGHRNATSLASFSISPALQKELQEDASVRMLIRTNRENGKILYLGESAGDDTATFLAVQVKDGKLQARVRCGGKAVAELDSPIRVDDNKNHTVRVERSGNTVQLFIDSFPAVSSDIPARFPHPLFAEELQLGSGQRDGWTVQEEYKGALQDIRLNSHSVILHDAPPFPIESVGERREVQNVLKGVVSDDVCSSSPCQNGKCRNTFNDFQCDCEQGWMGRRCSSRDHCALSPCPHDGQCENYQGGYVCTSPASLVSSSFARFEAEMEDELTLAFEIRTHSQEGHVITVPPSLSLSLSNGQLVMSQPGVAPFLVRKTVADGQWKKVRLENRIVRVGEASYELPSTYVTTPEQGNTTMLLGASASGMKDSFTGCMRSLLVGAESAPVSFYPLEEAGKGVEGGSVWRMRQSNKLHPGCLSSPQCGAADPCKHGAECIDRWNKHECRCPRGFQGEFCEVNIDECAGVSCGRGYCVDGVGEYRCHCDSGFTGANCEEEVDQCAVNPCKNQGLCSTSNGTFSCECDAGWLGRTCSVKSTATCRENPCANGGVCQQSGDSFTCRCPPTHSGPLCEVESDVCSSHPCKHGVCRKEGRGFKCHCEPGYAGPTCSSLSTHCTASSCGGRGVCAEAWNTTICTCKTGWRGSTCSVDADECLSIPCENGAHCENTEGAYKCTCRKYYMGADCSVAGSCLSLPCQRGECVQMKHDEHMCACPRGYEGKACEIRIDYCASSPCQNGARCESLIGEHKCHCPPGYTGPNCEVDIDDCASTPCEHGGRCRDRVNGYTCECAGTGYTGDRCQSDIDECETRSNCQQGTCTNRMGGYKCDCTDGWIGARCSVRDPCEMDERNQTRHDCVHGRCTNPSVISENGRETAGYECRCQRGFSGPRCATKVDERRTLALSYILGPVIAVLLVLCILGCALFLFVLKGKRAMHGHYSPSHQERGGARMQMSNMMKMPPEERLI